MQVLCLSWFNNGNQHQLLAEALRKYSDYEALHINVVKTKPMLYDSDVWLAEVTTPEEQRELMNKIKDAEFFIFSEFLPNSREMKSILKPLGIYEKVTPDNTIIRTGGSVVAYNAEHYLLEQIKHGWMYTGGAHDFSISSKIGLVAPTRNICPVDMLPEPNPPEDKVRICFAPTKEVKGVKPFTRVMKRITKEYGDVEFVPITNKTWSESVKIKSTCSATADQFWICTYANSSLESMAMSHAVLSRIDKWTLLLHPDLPIINVWSEKELYKKLEWVINNPKEIERIGKKGRAFVEKWHTPEVVAEQWIKLIEFVREKRSQRWESYGIK